MDDLQRPTENEYSLPSFLRREGNYLCVVPEFLRPEDNSVDSEKRALERSHFVWTAGPAHKVYVAPGSGVNSDFRISLRALSFGTQLEAALLLNGQFYKSSNYLMPIAITNCMEQTAEVLEIAAEWARKSNLSEEQELFSSCAIGTRNFVYFASHNSAAYLKPVANATPFRNPQPLTLVKTNFVPEHKKKDSAPVNLEEMVQGEAA